ncbi:Transforming growth factor-beta-induced protein ig-h3, partial [Stegodyphus mimosarum]
MGASRMVSIAQKVGLTETLHSNNYTILCPLNSALESFDVKYKRKKNQLKKNVKLTKKRKLQKSKLSDWITSHMIQGFHKMDELSDDRKMQAVNQATKIRFNIYYNPEKVVTANCIPIVSGDHFARNGVIHQIQKALPRPYKTVADVIAGDAQFSVLKG